MSEFDPHLICNEHQQKIDVYCKNPECKIETRICCNTCAQEFHNHQTTRIWELKNVYNCAIQILKQKDKWLDNLFQEIQAKVYEFSKIIKNDVSFLEELIDTPQSQTLKNLKKGLWISASQNLLKLSEKINMIGTQPITDYCISSKTTQYVKLLEENKNDEAKEVLQDMINRYKQNEIYKREMKRLKGELDQNSKPQNIQDSGVDASHLILQYQSFLVNDQNTKEALKILDQLLENDKQNFIYLRERARLARETIDYSVADDNFFFGNYKVSVQDCDKLLGIRKESRIYYQKGLSLFYLKQYDNALKSIDQAIKIDIENIQYHISKCQLLFAKKDSDNLKVEALDLKNSFDSINKVIEGQILMLQEEYEKAQNCFDEAIKINYFSFEAHFLKALSLSKVLKTKEMIITPEQILQNNLRNQPLDMNKFRRFYNMYLEGNNYQNNQIQLNPGRQDEFYQALRQFHQNGNQAKHITPEKQ